MRIQNCSKISTPVFYSIIDFITQYTKYSALGTLYIDDSKDVFTYGMCYRIAPELDEIHFAAPSLVELWVRPLDTTYSAVTLGVLGEVRVYDWEEEVLLVLAHELSHLDAAHGYPEHFPTDKDKEAEESAERFAISILERYRAKKNFGIG